MVFGNRAQEIGDIILIVAKAPIVGVVKLTGFTTDVVGETIERYFYKEFSYSLDGLFFTPFQELTVDNLVNIQFDIKDSFYINYKYTRIGTYSDGFISFNSVTLLGEFSEPLCNNYFILPKSIFRDIFCYNPEHLGLCAILTKKCYDEGIVPNFLIRGKSENYKKDDKDYIDFWDAVCCFYSLLIVFARRFQNYGRVREMLIIYLKQFNYFFCNDIELADLQNIKVNQYHEIKKRGTRQIFNEDGEFLRLICYDQSFFLFSPILSHWLVDVSCPTYGGFSQHSWINIVKDYTLDQFGIIENGGNIIQDSGGAIIISQVPDDQICGLDYENDKEIIIDSKFDYKLSFDVMVDTENIEILTVGIIGLDKDNNRVDSYNINTSLIENEFLTRVSLPIRDKKYSISCIIFNENQKQLNNSLPNIATGTNLKFGKNVVKVGLKIGLDRRNNGGTLDSSISIENINLSPLVSGNAINKENIVIESSSPPLDLSKIWYNPNNKAFAKYQISTSSWVGVDNLQQTLGDLHFCTYYRGYSYLDRKQGYMLMFKNNNIEISLTQLKEILKTFLTDYSSQYLLINY